MKISTRGRYCTRMMLELALHYGKGPMLLKDIAKNQCVSMKYLSQLILPLKVAGLINGTTGAHGGYTLARPPEQISLSDIITAAEGSLSPVGCVDNPEMCERAAYCATIDIWRELSKKTLEVLQSNTLKDLVDTHYKKKSLIDK